MLQGVRILDLTRLLPGPYASMILREHGAEVIKIEDLDAGDYLRNKDTKPGEMNQVFRRLNKGKKSLSLNLKSSEGKEVFLQLVKTSDVVIEGFRPGVMNKLGIGYDRLKEVNPSIIFCSISGYGQNGPFKEKPGHDLNYIGYSGLLSLNRKEGEKPTIPPLQIADLAGGALTALSSILMALIHRFRTGEGQSLDISMLDGTISLMQFLMPGILKEQAVLTDDLLTGGYACYNVYETKDKKFIAVGALEKKFWQAFCELMGYGRDWINFQRIYSKQEEMIQLLEAQFFTETQNYWLDLLSQKETCCSPVLELEEVMQNEQVQARRLFTEGNLKGEKVINLCSPIVSSVSLVSSNSTAPSNGEDTRTILKDMGYDDAKIESLKKSRVI